MLVGLVGLAGLCGTCVIGENRGLALIAAAAACRLEDVRDGIERGTSPNFIFEGDTPLAAALEKDCLKGAELLLRAGADLDNPGADPKVRSVLKSRIAKEFVRDWESRVRR